MNQIVLIDGKNLCYRAYYSHRGLSSNGIGTGAIHGSLSMILSLASRLPDTPFVWVWDGEGKTWRHRLAASTYKTNRVPVDGQHLKDVKSVHEQIAVLKKFLRRNGFRSFEVPALEGDDLMGILAKAIVKKDLAEKVIIYSSDKDFYQFIGKRIQVLKGLQDGRLKWASPDDIEKEYKVPVAMWAKFRALMGDPSDNIPQVFEGVGIVTSAKFVLDGIDPSQSKPPIKSIKVRGKVIELAANWDKVQLNYKLCQIPTRCDYPMFTETVKLQLRNLIDDLSERKLRRKKSIVNDDQRYNNMVRFLSKYQMESLITRRADLWGLP